MWFLKRIAYSCGLYLFPPGCGALKFTAIVSSIKSMLVLYFDFLVKFGR